MSWLSSFDVFPKYKEDVQVKTLFGASVSLCAILIMIILFLSEFWDYLSIKVEDHLVIDSTNFEKLPINFNLTFNRIPCSMISVDVIDGSGTPLHVENENIAKTSLNKDGEAIGEAELAKRGGTIQEHEVLSEAQEHGLTLEDHHSAHPNHNHNHKENDEEDEDEDDKDDTDEDEGGDEDKDTDQDKEEDEDEDATTADPCGSCYGAEEKEGDCCQTCDDIKTAYHNKGWGIPDISQFVQCVNEGKDGSEDRLAIQRGEGCHIAGLFEVKRGQGNFHIAPGYSFSSAHSHSHSFGAFESGLFDASHIIHHLSFGKELTVTHISDKTLLNPLDNTKHNSSFDGGSIFQYYAKVVPTEYTALDGSIEVTNQFSVTMHETKLKLKQGYGIPGVYFFYEFSPLMVKIYETRKPFYHFLTQVCAIIGGIFTITGLLDRLVYGTLKSLKFKQGINKNT